MNKLIVNKIEFPVFTGIKCNMMPFIQGDRNSLPEEYQTYGAIISQNYLEKGEIGFLTIHESFVVANTSQRGYNSKGINRNVHIEVGRPDQNHQINCWAGKYNTQLNDDTMVLIANSISDTCRVWDEKEMGYTKNGDLSDYIDKYPSKTGIFLKSGEVAKISIFTPHECVNQKESSVRQFFRIIGKGVTGRENHFTINPLMN